jgi:hypothetical protein
MRQTWDETRENQGPFLAYLERVQAGKVEAERRRLDQWLFNALLIGMTAAGIFYWCVR